VDVTATERVERRTMTKFVTLHSSRLRVLIYYDGLDGSVRELVRSELERPDMQRSPARRVTSDETSLRHVSRVNKSHT
jgi:hypothetical protein